MPFAESTLIRAIENADLDLLRRAIDSGTLINRTDGNKTTALHRAVDRDIVEPDVVALLARAGCALFVGNADGETVVDVATRRRHNTVLEFLLDPDNHGGPRWHRDSLRLGAPLIVLRVTRGAGFGFDPDDIELPFRCEGTYMGFGQEIDAEEGREMFDDLVAGSGWPFEWFRPYVDKIAACEDFDLQRLIEEHGEQCERIWYRQRLRKSNLR